MNDLVCKRWARILIKRDSSELSRFVMACPARTIDGQVVVLSRKSSEITQALPPRHECWDGPQLGETEGQGIIRSSDPVSKCPPGCKSGRDGISGIKYGVDINDGMERIFDYHEASYTSPTKMRKLGQGGDRDRVGRDVFRGATKSPAGGTMGVTHRKTETQTPESGEYGRTRVTRKDRRPRGPACALAHATVTPTAPRDEPAKCVLADGLPFSQQQGQQKATHTGRSPPQSRSREIRSGGSRGEVERYSRLDVNRLQNKGGAKRLVIGRGLTKSEISDADWRRHGTTIMRGAGK